MNRPATSPTARKSLLGLTLAAGAVLAWGLPDAGAQQEGRAAEPARTQPQARAASEAPGGVVRTLMLADAKKAILTAEQKAREMGVKMNIAVVDAGANLIAFERMDGAWLGSTDIAIKKAKTARYFDMPTGELGKLSQPGRPLYQIEVSNDGLITFPGGVPIKDARGNVIGAIGVSGSTVDDDHTVATAGAEALGGE